MHIEQLKICHLQSFTIGIVSKLYKDTKASSKSIPEVARRVSSKGFNAGKLKGFF